MEDESLFRQFIGEILGTFILILLGDGVVANVAVAPRLASEGYNQNTIAGGWGFAVVFAVYAVGGVSGAHINPAVTLGLAVKGDFPWRKVIPSIIARMIGAFLGALGVYLVYLQGLRAADMPNVWCTGPGAFPNAPAWGATGVEPTGSYALWNAFIAELFGTAMLLWIVTSTIDMNNLGVLDWNLQPFMIGMGVAAIGFALGGPSGYSINPARDLAPRVFGALAGTEELFDGWYWLLPPVTAPLIGGALGAISYDWLVTPGLPTPEEPVAEEE